MCERERQLWAATWAYRAEMADDKLPSVLSKISFRPERVAIILAV